jgi:hypothetical protein
MPTEVRIFHHPPFWMTRGMVSSGPENRHGSQGLTVFDSLVIRHFGTQDNRPVSGLQPHRAEFDSPASLHL